MSDRAVELANLRARIDVQVARLHDMAVMLESLYERLYALEAQARAALRLERTAEPSHSQALPDCARQQDDDQQPPSDPQQ